MKRLSLLKFLIALLILPAFIIGCDDKTPQQWTQSEKENIIHFIKSVHLVDQAENARGKRAMRKMYEQAIEQAETVTDDILAKAHPDLPKYYREYFEKGANLRIIAWRDGRSDLDQEGKDLMAKWTEWYQSHRKEIDIYI